MHCVKQEFTSARCTIYWKKSVFHLRNRVFHNDVWTKFFISSETRRFSNHVSRLISRSQTFAIIVILDLKIHQSMWIHWLFFPKTWTKGHWPLDDLWPHVCWSHMCDSTQGSLCPSPMTIHQCMWIQWSILQNTTYIHTHTTYILRTYYVHTTYYIHTTYRMSDHIVSYWTQFRQDKKEGFFFSFNLLYIWLAISIRCVSGENGLTTRKQQVP